MIDRRTLTLSALALPLAAAVRAEAPGFAFASIDGGEIPLPDPGGRPALVVNTASQCSFTPQYEALQALHEAMGDRLLVLAVPSDDFGGQELESAAEVKEFCQLNYGLTLPMTEITRVRGRDAHPFYAWAAGKGVRPRWNFHKILIDAQGRLVDAFPAMVRPDDPRLLRAVAAAGA